jgi:chromosome segregation ATPase
VSAMADDTDANLNESEHQDFKRPSNRTSNAFRGEYEFLKDFYYRDGKFEAEISNINNQIIEIKNHLTILDTRVDKLDSKMDQLDSKMDKVLDEFKNTVSSLKSEFDKTASSLKSEFDKTASSLKSELDKTLSVVDRDKFWSSALLIGVFFAFIAILVALYFK